MRIRFRCGLDSRIYVMCCVGTLDTSIVQAFIHWLSAYRFPIYIPSKLAYIQLVLVSKIRRDKSGFTVGKRDQDVRNFHIAKWFEICNLSSCVERTGTAYLCFEAYRFLLCDAVLYGVEIQDFQKNTRTLSSFLGLRIQRNPQWHIPEDSFDICDDLYTKCSIISLVLTTTRFQAVGSSPSWA